MGEGGAESEGQQEALIAKCDYRIDLKGFFEPEVRRGALNTPVFHIKAH